MKPFCNSKSNIADCEINNPFFGFLINSSTMDECDASLAPGLRVLFCIISSTNSEIVELWYFSFCTVATKEGRKPVTDTILCRGEAAPSYCTCCNSLLLDPVLCSGNLNENSLLQKTSLGWNLKMEKRVFKCLCSLSNPKMTRYTSHYALANN